MVVMDVKYTETSTWYVYLSLLSLRLDVSNLMYI